MSEPKEKYQPLKVHPDPLTDRVFKIMNYSFDKNRKLVVTTYMGNYGEPAGYVIAVNGSPPKGTLFVLTGSEMMILYQHGKVKRMDKHKYPHDYETVQLFIKQKTEAVK